MTNEVLYCARGGLESSVELLRKVAAFLEEEESSPSLSVEQFPEDALRVLEDECPTCGGQLVGISGAAVCPLCGWDRIDEEDYS